MRKGISTSWILSNSDLLYDLPKAELYELGFFKSKDLPKIREFLGKREASYGIHAPFIFSFDGHPALTSTIEKQRVKNMMIMEKCASFSEKFGAEYMIVHFPNAEQKENWLYLLPSVSDFLVNLNKKLNIRIENVYGNEYFHDSEDYLAFLRDVNLPLCLDIGHLLLDSQIFGFDPIKFVNRISEYIAEVHIYYADSNVYKKCHHKPWGESEDFLNALNILRELDADFVIEATPQCPDGFDQLMNFWRMI